MSRIFHEYSCKVIEICMLFTSTMSLTSLADFGIHLFLFLFFFQGTLVTLVMQMFHGHVWSSQAEAAVVAASKCVHLWAAFCMARQASRLLLFFLLLL